jgi:hypothetical protein
MKADEMIYKGIGKNNTNHQGNFGTGYIGRIQWKMNLFIVGKCILVTVE